MRKLGLALAFVAGDALILTAISLAKGRDHGKRGDKSSARAALRSVASTGGRLDGYQETPSISTQARGSFTAEVENGTITFRLSYSGLEGGNATKAHLHLGQRHVMGGVSGFICGGGGQPACPAGASATITGTIAAANVVGPAGQGIAAGQIDELVAAIRAGAVYVNVHTGDFPGGAVRGQLHKPPRN